MKIKLTLQSESPYIKERILKREKKIREDKKRKHLGKKKRIKRKEHDREKRTTAIKEVVGAWQLSFLCSNAKM